MVRTSQPGENSHYGNCPVKRFRLCQPIHEDPIETTFVDPFYNSKNPGRVAAVFDHRRPINPDQIYYIPLKADSGSSVFIWS